MSFHNLKQIGPNEYELVLGDERAVIEPDEGTIAMQRPPIVGAFELLQRAGINLVHVKRPAREQDCARCGTAGHFSNGIRIRSTRVCAFCTSGKMDDYVFAGAIEVRIAEILVHRFDQLDTWKAEEMLRRVDGVREELNGLIAVARASDLERGIVKAFDEHYTLMVIRHLQALCGFGDIHLWLPVD